MVRLVVLAQLGNFVQPVCQPLIASLVTSQLEVFRHAISAQPVKSQLAVRPLLMPVLANGPLKVKLSSSIALPAITVL
jgi:hypothetical protein